MSSKTKIVVLHMKELIYTGIFALFGILFIVLLIIMFLPDKQKNSVETLSETGITSEYVPGIYTTTLNLNHQSVEVEVIVGESNIASVRLLNFNDDLNTMYPLLQPSIDSIQTQLQSGQSIDSIQYDPESKYTTLALLNSIDTCLQKASATMTEDETVSENAAN